LISKAVEESGFRIVFYSSEELEISHLISLGEKVSKKEPNSITIVISTIPTVQFAVFAGEKALEKGVDCSLLARRVLDEIGVGGGAGGRRNFARGGLASRVNIETFKQKALKAVGSVFKSG
jgi:alanyl-tRNA synthetase